MLDISWYQSLASSWDNFSTVFMTGGCGRGWHGQVPNEEVLYHKRSVQDVMIEDLQRQVAELIQRLVAQNFVKYRNIDGCDSESNFENPYHNLVLVQEQHGRDEYHGDLGFRIELSEFSSTLIVVSKSTKSILCGGGR
jgi:hypothetical protein